MTRISGILLIGFAILLYLLSAVTFIDYLYSLTIPDTPTAVENAFGKLVILIFMLVLARFSRAKGKALLAADKAAKAGPAENREDSAPGIDPGQTGRGEGTEK